MFQTFYYFGAVSERLQVTEHSVCVPISFALYRIFITIEHNVELFCFILLLFIRLHSLRILTQNQNFNSAFAKQCAFTLLQINHHIIICTVIEIDSFSDDQHISHNIHANTHTQPSAKANIK